MSTGTVIAGGGFDVTVTDWFPSSVQPVRAGMYQIRCLELEARFNTGVGDDGMRFFDGTRWIRSDRRHSNFGELSHLTDQWRGLAADPAGGAK